MLLKADKLVKKYHGKSVVNELSFEMQQGEIVGLLGPNGAGKTTAFYMTIGLIRPTSGSVFFHGKDVTEMAIHKRARLGMGYLAQEPSIFGSMTVEENILCILEALDLDKQERKKRCSELLSELGLERLSKKLACTLSGGERRRLEITRSLITNPSLLLLDEPFANIDPLAIREVKNLILHLKQRGISVLITDHNAREIFSIVDRSYLIQEGKVVIAGTTEELLASKEAKLYYLGDDFKL
jgi:lipopolysaccharide export system ATP-binding protein